MKLQMFFVIPATKQAAWIDFEPDFRLPTTEHDDDVQRVASMIQLPEGMEGFRIITAIEAWTFGWHPTYGCVPQLRDDMGDIVEVWPTNAELGGTWETYQVLPDGNYLSVMYVEPDATFQMGGAESTTRKKVAVPGGFMAKVPTTVRQWNWFARSVGKPLKATSVVDSKTGKTIDLNNHPVVEVSYWDACEFADWAGVGMPSEEEWEHAARGADGRKFPWGNTPPTEATCHCSVVTQKERTDDVDARPAGESPYGLRDMAGNAWEWTRTPHT